MSGPTNKHHHNVLLYPVPGAFVIGAPFILISSPSPKLNYLSDLDFLRPNTESVPSLGSHVYCPSLALLIDQ